MTWHHNVASYSMRFQVWGLEGLVCDVMTSWPPIIMPWCNITVWFQVCPLQGGYLVKWYDEDGKAKVCAWCGVMTSHDITAWRHDIILSSLLSVNYFRCVHYKKVTSSSGMMRMGRLHACSGAGIHLAGHWIVTHSSNIPNWLTILGVPITRRLPGQMVWWR